MGAGAGGRDRRRDRAGRRAAADRRQERRLQARVRQLLATSSAFIDGGGQKGVQRPVLPAGHAAADPPGRVHGDHVAQGLRPAGVARARRSARAATGGVLRAGVVRAHARAAAGRRDRAASARRTWSASSPRSKASRCRRATSRAGSAATTTSPRWSRPRAPIDSRDHRGAARQQERRCTTTTRTSRRSSTPAARSACSTTRCSTARTC